MPLPLLAFAIVAAGFALYGLVTPGDRQVGAFARVYSVALTQRNAEMIRSQIRRMRRWRFVGALAGFTAAVLVAVASGEAIYSEPTFLALAGGFAGGSIVAELTRQRLETPRVTAATAQKRRIRDYIAPWILASLATLGAVVAGFIVHAVVFRATSSNAVTADMVAPTRWSSVVFAAAAWMVLSVVSARTLTRLAQAPETAPSPDVFDAHRAIRSSAMVSVLGAYWMGMSALGSRVIWPLAMTDDGMSSWVSGIASIVVSIGISGGFLVGLNAVPRTGGYVRVPQVPHTRESPA